MKINSIVKLSFQSPRSGKFVSNKYTNNNGAQVEEVFQSPRSGKFVSNNDDDDNVRTEASVSIP